MCIYTTSMRTVRSLILGVATKVTLSVLAGCLVFLQTGLLLWVILQCVKSMPLRVSWINLKSTCLITTSLILLLPIHKAPWTSNNLLIIRIKHIMTWWIKICKQPNNPRVLRTHLKTGIIWLINLKWTSYWNYIQLVFILVIWSSRAKDLCATLYMDTAHIKMCWTLMLPTLFGMVGLSIHFSKIIWEIHLRLIQRNMLRVFLVILRIFGLCQKIVVLIQAPLYSSALYYQCAFCC